MKFEKLINSIKDTSQRFQSNTVKAINLNLTLRNWMVGYYIFEFEQKGEDGAEYGSKILPAIAKKIDLKSLAETNLKICRQFYICYPLLLKIALQNNKEILPSSIRQPLTDELQINNNQSLIIRQSLTDELKNQDDSYLYNLLITTSFTHFVEIIRIEDATKRRFFELLVLKTTPSVRELQRQINTLTYERLGLTKDSLEAFEQLKNKIEPTNTTDILKSHYFFDFLNLNQTHLIEETELEQALLHHLQKFILELGNGFCFGARQKRILIGDEYFFIDLVFYHRILKCHIIVELKTEKANHEHIGQLKTYLQFYKKNMMQPTDNPPVGLLLVTSQNKTLVEYAVADSDKELFVSQYLLQLPKKEQLVDFINQELKSL
ncbi:DUF1016 family protein [Pedobacter sp. SD-b]|uniref:DUF1016 family protein n=1 Tax=Pedobacter segetis TaxID=2793069 RepID=A0ABS1BH72_9SPHI|nr:PDDEXK nuclease domain-containing protein [Pedobacter segetis]MBK0382200.1 DUF1016 family protein [Pedobacter segetis]